MKILPFIMTYLFLAGSAFSQEIQAELSLISPPPVLKEGDIVEGTLKVWPLENADLSEFKKLENMTFANALNITEVENIEVSTNNADVVEAKLLFIVKRAEENTQQQLSYKGRILNIQVPPLKIAPPDKDPEDYYVLDQGVIYSNLGKIITAFVSLLLIITIFFKRKAFQSFIQKFKNDPIADRKKKLDEKFSKAIKREDYEELYAIRREWLNLINEMAPAYDDFFKTMERHQYKKNWNAEDLNEVKSSFEVISRSFK
ncbi:MAG: hypothetical protein PHY93_15900 [Bacteriovorax sp.]|nr:hypothetical protein [Bacteriovorax sp.]